MVTTPITAALSKAAGDMYRGGQAKATAMPARLRTAAARIEQRLQGLKLQA